MTELRSICDRCQLIKIGTALKRGGSFYLGGYIVNYADVMRRHTCPAKRRCQPKLIPEHPAVLAVITQDDVGWLVLMNSRADHVDLWLEAVIALQIAAILPFRFGCRISSDLLERLIGVDNLPALCGDVRHQDGITGDVNCAERNVPF